MTPYYDPNAAYDPNAVPMYQRRLSFGEAIRNCFSKYCTFGGRASLSEYWWWYLFTTLVGCVYLTILLLLYSQLLLSFIPIEAEMSVRILALALNLFVLALLLPSIAVTVRRLHDTGHGGQWCFISFVPFVGGIWLLILLCQESYPYENRFGPEPNMEPIG